MTTPANPTPAQDYEQHLVPILFRPWAKVLLQYANLQPAERVLDVACGTGIVSRTAAPIVGAQGTVIAIDINPAMLAVARSTPKPDGAAIDWREGSALSLPLPDQSFDLALCQQGIQFFPDKLQALKEMRRVLVSGGRVALSVNQSLEHNAFYRFFNEVFVRHLGVPALLGAFNFNDDLHALLTQAGFHDVELEVRSLPLHVPDPTQYVRSTVLGSAAVLTQLQVDAAAREALIEKVNKDMVEIFAQHTQNGALFIEVSVILGRAVA